MLTGTQRGIAHVPVSDRACSASKYPTIASATAAHRNRMRQGAHINTHDTYQ